MCEYLVSGEFQHATKYVLGVLDAIKAIGVTRGIQSSVY